MDDSQGAHSRERTVLDVRASVRYRAGFAEWLEANWFIWTRFCDEAHKIVRTGRSHYAARTIVEYLRHETALRQVGDGEFKINDHVTPDLARLFMSMNKKAPEGFFEFRGRA